MLFSNSKRYRQMRNCFDNIDDNSKTFISIKVITFRSSTDIIKHKVRYGLIVLLVKFVRCDSGKNDVCTYAYTYTRKCSNNSRTNKQIIVNSY